MHHTFRIETKLCACSDITLPISEFLPTTLFENCVSPTRHGGKICSFHVWYAVWMFKSHPWVYGVKCCTFLLFFIYVMFSSSLINYHIKGFRVFWARLSVIKAKALGFPSSLIKLSQQRNLGFSELAYQLLQQMSSEREFGIDFICKNLLLVSRNESVSQNRCTLESTKEWWNAKAVEEVQNLAFIILWQISRLYNSKGMKV
jgi:hypothetical protein